MLRSITARLAAWALRALALTWRVERDPWPIRGATVIALWHSELIPMVALHRAPHSTGGAPLVPIASLSTDGDLLAQALSSLGYQVIRGSSSRGGVGALRAALGALREGSSPVLAVDGPRGPVGKVQPGAEVLARRGEVPVVWGRIESTGWRARSWDRALVPWPFARVRVRYGAWRPGDGPLGEAMGGALGEALREALGEGDGGAS